MVSQKIVHKSNNNEKIIRPNLDIISLNMFYLHKKYMNKIGVGK